MLHLAIAGDVAKLLPFDDAAEGSTVADVHETASAVGEEFAGQAEIIREAALAPGALIDSLSAVDDQTSGDDDLEEDDLDTQGSGGVVGAVIKEDLDAMAGDVIDDVVTDIVERASRSGTAVLLALAGGGGHLVAELMPHLSDATTAAPADIREYVVRTVRRVLRLVRILISRARKALDAVLGGYRAAVQDLIAAADPTAWVGEAIAGNILARVVRSKDVRRTARARLSVASQTRPRVSG